MIIGVSANMDSIRQAKGAPMAPIPTLDDYRWMRRGEIKKKKINWWSNKKEGPWLRIEQLPLRCTRQHFKFMEKFSELIKSFRCTANVFNVIFTIFTGVPLHCTIYI